MDERRLQNRELTCIPAYLDGTGDGKHLGLIRDISMSGALVLTRSEIKVGEALRLCLYLGAQGEPAKEVDARVARVERAAPKQADMWPWRVGVEFTSSVEPHADAIAQIAERLKASGVLKPDN